MVPTELRKRAGQLIERWIKRLIWSGEDWGRALGSSTSGAGVLGGQELNLEKVKFRMIDRLKNKFGK